MILKLDPRYPLVWRDPSSAQLGIDPPLVRLDAVTQTQSLMLAALTVGVTEPGLRMIARGRPAERAALLKRIAPALLAPQPPVAPVALAGSGPLIDHIANSLAHNGVLVRSAASDSNLADSHPDLAILVHPFVVPPELHGFWLRRDVPHLPVVISDRCAVVGPVIEPGVGPCLRCIELHRRDADEAWPAIATQLLGRMPISSPALTLEVSALASRVALGRLREGAQAATSVRIDAATGDREYHEWTHHPDCGCRDIALVVGTRSPAARATRPGRRGIGWVAARGRDRGRR
ncbi:MAG: hypothetical protein EPN91_10975 [Salinibacterium sp.]|nr:MAG: hypothetical protein EPN91_10975 [Salinibacterium sp.]